MSIESYLQAMPKAELHIHLEGSIQPETLLKLSQRKNVKLPVETLEEMHQWFKFRNFEEFLEIFVHIYKCVTTVDDFELITYDLAANLAKQNVKYAEVSFSPSAHFSRGIHQSIYMEGLRRGRERACTELGVKINWVFDISRHRDRHFADNTTNVAIDGIGDGVIALGLSGNENGYPAEDFANYFASAGSAGLKSAPHAGELVGPKSVWSALTALQADRIAHGVRAVEDPALVKHLANESIALAISATSNLCLGVYPNLNAHPLPQLHAAGVQFTVNTDDPALFNTTLNREVELLHESFGFDLVSIENIVLNGIRHSFLADQKRREMTLAFEAEMDSLRAIHLN